MSSPHDLSWALATAARVARQGEQDRIIKILENAEWHNEFKAYSQQDTDLTHDSDYCWGCQMIAIIKKEDEK